MIINRYVTKEVLLNFIAITSILLFVALSNRFISLLAKVAIGQLPSNLVFKVIGLYIPELLSSLAPLGFFVAILFAYGRLHADSEMSVLFTCGVNWFYITKIAFVLSGIVAFIVLIFTSWLMPTIAEYREKVLAEGEAVGIMQAIVPGQFQLLNNGQLMFYVEDLAKDNKEQLTKVFITEQPQGGNFDKSLSLITAHSGYIQHKKDAATEDFFLILKDGHRYTGVPGNMDYTVVDFAEYGREIKTEAEETDTTAEQLLSTKQLWYSNKPGEKAELQWRLSLPLSVIVLGLLAVSLAKVSPRQGRFAKFLPAILLYIAYFNLMLVSKRWIGAGKISTCIGIWWVHFLFLLLGCLLLALVSGRLSQAYQTYIEKNENN